MQLSDGIIPARAGFTRPRQSSRASTADHPRSRGVYFLACLAAAIASGSSPLARGLRTTLPGCGRITSDHPRSRGVYNRKSQTYRRTSGSSPLARGLPGGGLHHILRQRIIPARAGFTRHPPPPWPAPSDHPRSRGVYLALCAGALAAAGSSPLARGLQLAGPSVSGDPRIIPARAGFTFRKTSRNSFIPDHPRSRGVYVLPIPRPPTEMGSSPLARGLPFRGGARWVGSGIIPARAGFTAADARVGDGHGDHPRSRGVYRSASRAPSIGPGSSPLARGLLSPKRTVPQNRRIIPARAGFTEYAGSATTGDKDHPRSRGVYSGVQETAVKPSGSSPLARGLRVVPRLDSLGCGIIPARAGFTRSGQGPHRGRSDHPRSRGVYFPKDAKSPGRHWIIPARAGFTEVMARRCVTARDHPRSRGVYAGRSARNSGSLGSSPLARGLRNSAPGMMPTPRDHPRSRGVYWARARHGLRQGGSSPLARGLPPT